jgi:hypothetical protein
VNAENPRGRFFTARPPGRRGFEGGDGALRRPRRVTAAQRTCKAVLILCEPISARCCAGGDIAAHRSCQGKEGGVPFVLKINAANRKLFSSRLCALALNSPKTIEKPVKIREIRV